MAEIQTTANNGSVDDFIASVDDVARRSDAVTLREIFERVTGEPAVMWGLAIIGFGSFHYKGKSSEGEWMTVGFSPRKVALSLYGLHGAYDEGEFEPTLGKHTTGKGCIYVKKLSDVDLSVLEQLIRASMERDPNS